MTPSVGFMGMGIMGVPMASHIARGGCPLVVFNRSRDKLRPLEELGARPAASPKELALASEAVVLMVTGHQAIDALLWGAEGAGEALDASKTVVNMSTVSPAYARGLAERVASTGAGFLDAPVLGTKKPAEDAKLLILAGGDASLVEKFTPLLSLMGRKVVHCGPAGQGSMMKMAANLMLGILAEGLAEAFHFALKGGLSTEAFLDVVLSGPLACPLFAMKASMLEENDFPASFPLKHMTKDLELMLDTAYETGAAVPAGQTQLHLYKTAVNRGWGDHDFAAVSRVIQLLARED